MFVCVCVRGAAQTWNHDYYWTCILIDQLHTVRIGLLCHGWVHAAHHCVRVCVEYVQDKRPDNMLLALELVSEIIFLFVSFMVRQHLSPTIVPLVLVLISLLPNAPLDPVCVCLCVCVTVQIVLGVVVDVHALGVRRALKTKCLMHQLLMIVPGTVILITLNALMSWQVVRTNATALHRPHTCTRHVPLTLLCVCVRVCCGGPSAQIAPPESLKFVLVETSKLLVMIPLLVRFKHVVRLSLPCSCSLARARCGAWCPANASRMVPDLCERAFGSTNRRATQQRWWPTGNQTHDV